MTHGIRTLLGNATASLVLTLLFSSFCWGALVSSQWSEGFESYPLGSFPTNGGWVLAYEGSGTQYQYVDNTHAASGAQSLHLAGSSCWAAEAYRPLVIPDSSVVEFEAAVFVDAIVSGGCTPAIAHVALSNPGLDEWGTYYGLVYFDSNGEIDACTRTYPLQLVPLMSYAPRQWYRVRVVADLASRSFEVYINGQLKGTGLPIQDEGSPTAFEATTGHGDSPVAWFDEITVDIGAPIGACCQPSGNCTLETEGDCLPPGVWQGPNTNCTPSPCLEVPVHRSTWGAIKHLYE